jgi:antitoxin PrlF
VDWRLFASKSFVPELQKPKGYGSWSLYVPDNAFALTLTRHMHYHCCIRSALQEHTMPTTLEAESTLTDRYQTTVPETVRRALRLRKRDKIQYVIHPSGEVVLTRASNNENNDPVLGQFLGFLTHDIATHPSQLQWVSSDFVQRVQSLIGEVDVDLDAPLSEDDE